MHVIAGQTPGWHTATVIDLDSFEILKYVREADEETGICIEYMMLGDKVALQRNGNPMVVTTHRNILIQMPSDDS